ncbi:ROK family transcriptional regulator [Cellulomonas sp. PhB143]|uniref:ROK family transcriptional regulator n=1 Tax=Cellulomonas sp. PhB143 TaxID=2485186 RepID=UPI000F482FD2|nr:ROK family transcriptional regulator [Cellulomonas sp. PhB143]ROS78941.1 putative NBD/HSP70 family sugar kinase [Cellulomonas sp. PhB143]
MLRGASFPVIAAYNETLVLEALRRTDAGLSRVALSRETALSAQTVSNVSRRLLERGLIREVGRQRTHGPGQPPITLRLDPEGVYAIGVHLDPSVITCVLLDFTGAVVAEEHRVPPDSGDPAATVALTTGAIAALVERLGDAAERITGIGIAAPGPIDAVEGVVVRPRLVPGWSDLHLRDEVREVFDLPVVLAKDVVAAAVAESWRNPAEPGASYAVVYWGTGVGVGLVLDGEVHTGSTQNAGDVGHAIVDPEGPVCVCGRRGCFGEVVRPYRMVVEGLQKGAVPLPDGVVWGPADPSPTLPVETIRELFGALAGAAADGDAVAREVVDHAIRSTALYVTNLVALLDLERVVFGGPSWAPIAGRVLELLPQEIGSTPAEAVAHQVEIVASEVGPDAAAVGAACLLLAQRFSPRSMLREPGR